MGEIAFRAILFSDIFESKLIDKYYHHFSNFYIDDNTYRLVLRVKLKGREKEQIFPEFDPILGWTAKAVTEDNPLGMSMSRKYTLNEFKGRSTLLIFGDSFIHGVTKPEYNIPQLLDNVLDSTLVLNFGVKGYGLDQMYLRLRSVIDLFDNPHIMVGILYPDLDRCIYKVMQSPKPYFEVLGDSLILKGVPIPTNYGQWLERYPITISSYVIAGLNGIIRRALKTRWGVKYLFKLHPSESTKRRDEKKAICRKIIENIKKECDRRNASLTFVLFPMDYHMIHEGWYEVFLKEAFKE